MSETIPTKMKYTYTVTAVVFGADETILNVNLENGFKFVKRSLNTRISNLDRVFETDGLELRREYEAAVIDPNNLSVICIEKGLSLELENTKAREEFDKNIDNDLTSIDNQIRTIRFLNEGAVRFIKIAFKMSSEKVTDHRNVNFSSCYSAIIPISESHGSESLALMHLDSNAVQETNSQIKNGLISFSDSSLNICHMYYDLSYFSPKYISIVLLITALEMIFLKSEQAKKEKLSKRSAVYLYNDEAQILLHFNNFVTIYKKRSDFIHDGKIQDISINDIVFLRKCLRDIILLRLYDTRNKTELINDLKEKVKKIWKEA